MIKGRLEAYIDRIQKATVALAPKPPAALPPAFAERCFPEMVGSLAGIKAVLFDIYGTLFISGAGDMATSGAYQTASVDSLAAEFTSGLSGEQIKAYFNKAVSHEHQRLLTVTAYPEVRVEELWAGLPGLAVGSDPVDLALGFELAVNPCYPMPGLVDSLLALKKTGLWLGVVSNAQVFTPIYFKALLDKDMTELGFTDELCLYSFAVRRAKPGPELFKAAVAALAKRGIKASESLFVGNDMLNDIYAASKAGFKTCLLAADARSLRLRLDNPQCGPWLCQAVITSLMELPALCAVSVQPTGLIKTG